MRLQINSLIYLIVLKLIFSISSLSIAQEIEQELDCTIPDSITKTRPSPKGTPTDVGLGLFFIDVRDINSLKQTFTVDVIVSLNWNDPRLSEKSLGRSLEDCNVKLNEIWHPDLSSLNRVEAKQIKEDVIYIDRDGNVNVRQRYKGRLFSEFDLKNFPFDNQILHLILLSIQQDRNDITFLVSNKSLELNETPSSKAWRISLLEPKISTEYVASQNSYFSKIDIRLYAKRDKEYYLWNVILPLGFIVMMAWSVFWINPSQIGPQIGLATAAVFTLIAYRFTLHVSLPQVSYLTRMDKFIFLSTLLVFLALGEAIATSSFAYKGKEDLALKTDKCAKLVYLALFAIIIVYSFLG